MCVIVCESADSRPTYPTRSIYHARKVLLFIVRERFHLIYNYYFDFISSLRMVARQAYVFQILHMHTKCNTRCTLNKDTFNFKHEKAGTILLYTETRVAKHGNVSQDLRIFLGIHSFPKILLMNLGNYRSLFLKGAWWLSSLLPFKSFYLTMMKRLLEVPTFILLKRSTIFNVERMYPKRMLH